MTAEITCPKCAARAPVADWPLNRRTGEPAKRCAGCLEYVREKSRQWREANPEKAREIKRRWYANEKLKREAERAELAELAELRARVAALTAQPPAERNPQ